MAEPTETDTTFTEFFESLVADHEAELNARIEEQTSRLWKPSATVLMVRDLDAVLALSQQTGRIRKSELRHDYDFTHEQRSDIYSGVDIEPVDLEDRQLGLRFVLAGLVNVRAHRSVFFMHRIYNLQPSFLNINLEVADGKYPELFPTQHPLGFFSRDLQHKSHLRDSETGFFTVRDEAIYPLSQEKPDPELVVISHYLSAARSALESEVE